MCEFYRARQRGKCVVCGNVSDNGGDTSRETCGNKACRMELRRRRLPQLLGRCDVPPRYRNCSFESFDVLPAVARKVELLRNLAKEKLKRGIFLFGPVGAGKTHLAVALLAEQLVLGSTGQFIRSMDFSSRCRGAFRPENDTTVDLIVEDLLDSDVLIFDDLGADKSSDFLRESLLNLFDRLYSDERPVIVTSNLTIEKLNDIEPRLASRIAQMCPRMELTGQDFRIRKANEALREARKPSVSELARKTRDAELNESLTMEDR